MDDGMGAVRRIVEGWPTMTADDWREVCTDDVDYRNMPWEDIVTVGPDAVHEVLQRFAARFDVRFDIGAIGSSDGRAFAERVEHFTPRPGEEGEAFHLPVLGVFDLDGGKVAAWRDYFDRRAMKA
ncbi:MAG: nuclear transport factor 2 family protein [Acidimicrobiales bacterium]